MAGILNVTHDTFQADVLESPLTVLVDFYSNRCGPCRALAPVLEALVAEANGRFKILKVDTDDQLDLAIEYGVTALPTLLIFKNGKVKVKLVGLQKKATLVKALKEVG